MVSCGAAQWSQPVVGGAAGGVQWGWFGGGGAGVGLLLPGTAGQVPELRKSL